MNLRQTSTFLFALFLTAIALAQIGGGGITGGGGGGASQTTTDFTVTWSTGFTVNQTQNMRCIKIGSVVFIHMLQAVTGTSNSTNLNTGSGEVPSTCRPTVDMWVNNVRGSDNGNAVNVCFQITTAGQIIATMRDITGTDVICAAAVSWTNSGTKQIKIESQNGPSVFMYTTD